MPSLPTRVRPDKFTFVPGRAATVCAACDRPIFVQPAIYRSHPRHFCNRTCKDAFRRPPIERLMEKVEKQPNGCWRFMGAKTPEGYGRVNLTGDGRGWVGAHVLSYELHIGPIPEGMELDHVQARGCRFRDCVNPDHLEPVTPLENNLRREVHTRGTCVNGHPRTPENTLYKPNGAVKQCRVCQRERQRGRRR